MFAGFVQVFKCELEGERETEEHTLLVHNFLAAADLGEDEDFKVMI